MGSSYSQIAQKEYPRTETDQKAYFKAVARWVSSQWKAMNDAERAVRANLLHDDQRDADHLGRIEIQ